MKALNYFGGKSRPRLYQWINSLVPYDKDGLYVEPFAGMLGMLMNRLPSRFEIINDLDNNIYTFWSVVRGPDYKQLKRMCKYSFHCRQSFNEAWEILHGNRWNDDVMRAWAVYTVVEHGVMHGTGKKGFGMRMSKSGSKKLGGCHFAERLKVLHERMKNVQVECKDALVVLDRMKNIDHAVIYCDPPYATADTSQYTIDAVDTDKMGEILLKQSGRVAISGYGKEWDHLGWHKEELEVPYIHVGEHTDNLAEVRTECLWMNYAPPKQTTLF